MTVKSIVRRWIGTGTNGKLQKYTEERYISKHSSSFRQAVTNKANKIAFLRNFKKDFKTVTELLDAKLSSKSLVSQINNTNVFTINSNSVTTISLQQYKKMRYNDLIKKCCNGALLSLSGKVDLGATAPKEDVARQVRKCLVDWTTILYPSLLPSYNSESTNNKTSEESSGRSSPNEPNTKYKTISTLSAVISIDFEWQLGSNEVTTETGEVVKHRNTRRSFGDVLSCQYAIFLPDYPNCEMSGIIFNDSSMGFNFRALMLKLTDVIQKEFHALDSNHQPIVLELKHLKMLLTGYFMGVDLSCMTGWNKLPLKLVVLGKHRIFTRMPYKFDLRRRKGAEPVVVTMTIRDTASIAPMGGLKQLGIMVNQPKIDVTKQDAIDFATHKISLTDYCHYLHDGGFYKNHMKLLQQRHFKLYCDYALNDSIVALKYLKMFMRVFALDWSDFRNVPITTTNHSLLAVANSLKNDCVNQRIFDPNISFADVRDNPLNACRDHYRDLYIFATNAYFGGFNTAFCSVVIPRCVVVDTDLTSAYVLASALMPRPDYSAKREVNSLKHLFKSLVSLDKNAGISFSQLYKALHKAKGFPFLFGVIKADIDYPDNYHGIILTPQRSPKTNNPCYVRHLKKKYVTLIDAIDAYQHGAKVTMYSAEIPAQDWNHYNAWADVQLNFLALRQEAKAKRDSYNEDSVEYKKYDAEQLLYKLCCNTIYGASAQAVLPKNSRDYETNKTEKIGISRVTDPVIAGTYTSITRYLAHHLYDAVASVYQDNVLPLNVTTDGYTFALHADSHFDEAAVNDAFNRHLPSFYHERLNANHFKAGFERKGDKSDTPTKVFNLRTRFNGTPELNSLDALGGIQDMTVNQVMKVIDSGQTILINHAKRFSNLTSMKFANDKRANHQAGTMFEWRQNVCIPLQYDCAYRPDEWLNSSWNGIGFTCEAFSTVQEHDEWKEHSKLLTDRWNITQSQDRFNIYLQSMSDYSFSRTAKTLDSSDYQARVRYVIAKVSGQSPKTIRAFKNTLYSTQQALKAGRKLPICRLAVFTNWKLKESDDASD